MVKLVECIAWELFFLYVGNTKFLSDLDPWVMPEVGMMLNKISDQYILSYQI